MKQPYLKRYLVTWKHPAGGRHQTQVLAKSADAARNLVKKDYSVAKSRQMVSRISEGRR